MWTNYSNIFRIQAFRRFWLGFTFSELGDAMTRVALTWFVYEKTNAPEALGWLMLCYTGPVILGGLVAGTLLDRFERRKIMFADNVLRGTAMAAIPLLYAFNALELWHIYTVAAIYGLLYMISLAGGPALIPSLVARSQLATANALETLSFTLGSIVGPVAAGILIPVIGAPNVLILDAFSYFLYAFALGSLRPTHETGMVHIAHERVRLGDAVQLLVKNPVLLTTTLMYMVCNFGGGGILGVVLPIYTAQTLQGGSALYGSLLGVLAAGQVVSSLIAGGRSFTLPLGVLICFAALSAGIALVPLAFFPHIAVAALSLFLFGALDAPLTVWAQTLRMQVIPEPMRGRMFALIRTLIQSFGPLGAVFGGLALALVGVQGMLFLAAALVAVPGALGLRVRALRSADRAAAFDEAI